MNNDESIETNAEVESRYLIFGLADLLFAVPLLQVRELVEFQEPKPLPNTRPYCVGAINLRGEIVGLIDLRLRFGLPATKVHRAALMVCESPHGTIAAVVERVLCVASILPERIDRSRHLQRDAQAGHSTHVIGVTRRDEDVINILDLSGLLNDDDTSHQPEQQLSA